VVDSLNYDTQVLTGYGGCLPTRLAAPVFCCRQLSVTLGQCIGSYLLSNTTHDLID